MALRGIRENFQNKELTMKSNVATAESSQQLNVDDRSISNMNLPGSESTHFLENVVKSNTAVINGSVDLARETLTFSRTRLQANFDAWMALSTCKNLGELSECQVDAAKKATSQYAEAASTIINRFANVISSVSAPVQEQSRSL
jgi:hypothetical protein